jgi:hypothetical protein
MELPTPFLAMAQFETGSKDANLEIGGPRQGLLDQAAVLGTSYTFSCDGSVSDRKDRRTESKDANAEIGVPSRTATDTSSSLSVGSLIGPLVSVVCGWLQGANLEIGAPRVGAGGFGAFGMGCGGFFVLRTAGRQCGDWRSQGNRKSFGTSGTHSFRRRSQWGDSLEGAFGARLRLIRGGRVGDGFGCVVLWVFLEGGVQRFFPLLIAEAGDVLLFDSGKSLQHELGEIAERNGVAAWDAILRERKKDFAEGAVDFGGRPKLAGKGGETGCELLAGLIGLCLGARTGVS